MISVIMAETFDVYNEKSEDEKANIPHVNCCEHMLMASHRSFNEKLPPEVLALAKGFGGGMKIKSVCGALTGGVMSLSKFYHEASFLEVAIQDFFKTFENKYETIHCDLLKERHYDERIGCQKVMLMAAEVLDEIIEKAERGYYE